LGGRVKKVEIILGRQIVDVGGTVDVSELLQREPSIIAWQKHWGVGY